MPDEQEQFPRLKHGVPEFLGKWIDAVADWCEAHRPLSGVNINLTDAPGKGKAINYDPGSAGAGIGPFEPFQVITRIKTGSDGKPLAGQWQFAVMFGQLNKTGTDTNTATITGIPTIEDALNPVMWTWYDWNGSADYVYLDLTAIDLTSDTPVTFVEVNSQSQGGMFDNTADAWSGDNAYVSGSADPDVTGQVDQDEACVIIAYINSGPGGAPVVTPKRYYNMVVANFPIDAQAAVWPVAA